MYWDCMLVYCLCSFHLLLLVTWLFVTVYCDNILYIYFDLLCTSIIIEVPIYMYGYLFCLFMSNLHKHVFVLIYMWKPPQVTITIMGRVNCFHLFMPEAHQTQSCVWWGRAYLCQVSDTGSPEPLVFYKIGDSKLPLPHPQI